MKHIKGFLLAILLLSGLWTQPVSAQRGEKTLGVAGGYATFNNSGYAKIYFQYSFSDHIRIAPELGYVFKHKGLSSYEGSVDMQFPFRISKGFHLYPLAGVTFNNWNREEMNNISRIGADFGGGADLYITSNLKLSIQGKYSIMKTCGSGYFDLGFGYIF